MIDVKKTGSEVIISEIELKGNHGFMVEINNVDEYRDVFNMLYAFIKELSIRTKTDISEICLALEQFDAELSDSLIQQEHYKSEINIKE